MNVDIQTGHCFDLLKAMASDSIDCCITSPPYFNLRDYAADQQIGRETTVAEYVTNLVAVFHEVRRVLKPTGTLWLNLGDTYATNRRCGVEAKNLIGIPWRIALALQDDGWILRQDIIWHKPNAMPEPARDRCTKSHEYIFILAKSPNYFFDGDAIREPHDSAYSRDAIAKAGGAGGPRPVGNNFSKAARHGGGIRTPSTRAERAALLNPLGRNKRSVWSVRTMPYRGVHCAVYPEALIEPCVLAGCRAGGTVLDPFGGSGTTGVVADRLGRNAILLELNPVYAEVARYRIAEASETIEPLKPNSTNND